MNFSNSQYAETSKGLSKYGKNLNTLIEELLIADGVQYHSVSHRVKEPKSVVKKLSSDSEKYSGIEDLTDLLGIRVITYFPKDVDLVAEILKKEFILDKNNSIDKRKMLDPDKFGYLSLHFVVMLKSSRADLAEYKRFAKTKFEIQIRSILQHAWAEIEHDLGYKAEGTLPDKIRRNFSRLAGLLELADDEFERIRESISKYEKHVIETIDSAPQNLPIDQSTLVAAVSREKVLRELDQVVADAGGRNLTEKVSPSYIANQARELKILGIRNIDQLLSSAEKNKHYVEAFAKVWLGEPDSTKKQLPFNRGIGLFYLCYVLVAQKSDEAVVGWNHLLQKNHPNIIKRVRNTWKQVIAEFKQT